MALHYPWSMKQDPSPGVWGRDVYQRLWVEVHQTFFKIHWQNLSRFQRKRIPESQLFLSVFLWTLIKFGLFSSLLAKLIRWTLKFQAKTRLESLGTLQIEYPFAFHNSPFLFWEQLLCLNAPEKTVRTIIVKTFPFFPLAIHWIKSEMAQTSNATKKQGKFSQFVKTYDSTDSTSNYFIHGRICSNMQESLAETKRSAEGKR